MNPLVCCSFDLLVLREIVQNMSGVETTSGLTQDQLEAWAGGDLLRQEVGPTSIILEDNTVYFILLPSFRAVILVKCETSKGQRIV